MSDQGSSALSVAEMVANLRAYGLTKAEIAGELGRSVRMVTKIERAETSGELYRPVLSELYEQGRRTSPRPPRRRAASGELIAVRAKGGGTAPPAPAGPEVDPGVSEQAPGYTPTYTEPPKRGRFSTAMTYLTGGGRQVEVTAPKSNGSGRQLAEAELQDEMKRAAQGKRRVKFSVEWSNGRVMEIGGRGGYNASDVNARSRSEGQAPFQWLANESAGRYADIDPDRDKIIGVTMTTYGRQRPQS